MQTSHSYALAVLALLAAPAFAAVPPPEPEVSPMILMDIPSDADWNRINDELDVRVRQARLRGAAEELGEMVAIETVFTRQIRQSEIDAFLALGGEIDHVFRAVSYGWQGRLPLGSIEQAARSLGSELVIIQEHREVHLHLQNATLSTGGRMTWSGMGGHTPGYRGNPAHRLAIMDTGIDVSHPDLAGRLVFWKDYSLDNTANPIDYDGHGTHVAAISSGSGDSQGGANGSGMTLRYSTSKNLSQVAAGNAAFEPSVELRQGRQYTISHRGAWQGGGTTNVALRHNLMGTADGLLDIPGSALMTASGYATVSFNFNPTQHSNLYPYLEQPNPKSITGAVQSMTITNYHLPNDGFNAYSGVAPLGQFVGLKVFRNNGVGSSADINVALDDLVTMRQTYNIRAVNMSLGVSGTLISMRAKVNTLALNGVLPIVSAGNDGYFWNLGDPARAAYALTVGAVNISNQATFYSQGGSTSGIDETNDYKPDVVAPGGSMHSAEILAADTNNSDGYTTALGELQTDDLTPYSGTSMAAPMVSGTAMLIMQALEDLGEPWSHTGPESAMLVKSLIAATAVETNQPRELGQSGPPTLERAGTAAPITHPGKDRYEGYGSLSTAAAVWAVSFPLPNNFYEFDGFHNVGQSQGLRSYAFRLDFEPNQKIEFALDVPGSHDIDMYLYSWQPSAIGNPVILASSTNAGLGANEAMEYTMPAGGRASLVLKCITGSDLTSTVNLTMTRSTNVPTITLGDINGDGIINVADVTELARRLSVGTPVSPALGDINDDGVVNVDDVQALAEMTAN